MFLGLSREVKENASLNDHSGPLSCSTDIISHTNPNLLKDQLLGDKHQRFNNLSCKKDKPKEDNTILQTN